MKKMAWVLGIFCVFLLIGCGQEEKTEQPGEETVKEAAEAVQEKATEKAEVALPGKGKTVTPGCATWTTGFFLEALYSRACEDLGYEVKDPKKLAAPVFYRSLAAGDLDFWANG